MLEIRIHGRGGQGNVVAAYLLATAAFDSGRFCQAFPSFGAERRGAPVTAFVRIADRPIRVRSQVRQPAFLIIQDDSLLHSPATLSGLKAGGGVLVNAASPPAGLNIPAEQLLCVPATALGLKHLGRNIPNVALLAAFISATGVLPLDGLVMALGERFSGDVLKRNLALVEQAAQAVTAGCWSTIAMEAPLAESA